MSFIDKKMKRKEEKVHDNIFLSFYLVFSISHSTVGGIQARDTVSLGAITQRTRERKIKWSLGKTIHFIYVGIKMCKLLDERIIHPAAIRGETYIHLIRN